MIYKRKCHRKIDPYSQQRNCSPLNVLFSGIQITLISHGVPPLGDVKQGAEKKVLQLNASVSRKREEIRQKLLLITNRKLHMRFRLAPRSMTLDDL